MPNDAMIETAIGIGKRNQEVIVLVKNWCAHAEIAVTGGIGLVEQQTGLPIGMRAIRCRHAGAHGISGMDLERVAIDFHDRNCVGCTHRCPVQLPNLTKLLGERDARRQQAAEERQRSQARLEAGLAQRSARRAPHLESRNHEKRSLLRLIDEFDRDPTEEKATLLCEGAVALRAGFDGDAEAALFDLASAGTARATPALTLLDSHTKDRRRLAAVALEAAGILDIADEIIAADLDASHAELVAGVMPQLLYAAAPERMLGLGHVSPNRGPLVSVARVNPTAVEVAMRVWLRGDEKRRRRVAAEALSELLDAGMTALGIKLVDDLIASFPRQDDGYDDGPAARVVSQTLGQIYLLAPDETEARIGRALERPDVETTLGIVDAYAAVCAEPRAAPSSVRRAMTWLAQAFARLPRNHEILDRLCDFWDRRAPKVWDVLAELLDPLLGTAALAQQQIDTQPTTQLIDLDPPMLRSMEEDLRRRDLERAAEAALEVARVVAAEHPDGAVRTRVFDSIRTALSNASAAQERWRGRLVTFLGTLAIQPESAAAILPIIYASMTDGSVAVRAGAIRAYQSMVGHLGSDSVPDLMHQLVVAMLRDSYLMVHSAALEAIDKVGVPAKFSAEASVLAANWFATHARTRTNSWLAELAARVLLRLQTAGKRKVPAQLADFVLATALQLEPYQRDHVLGRWAYALSDAPTFPASVLRLVHARRDETPSADDLMRLLSLLSIDEFAKLAPGMAQIVVTRVDDFVDMFNELWFLFMDAMQPAAAAAICDARLNVVPDTPSNAPLRLHLSIRRASAALESAAQAGNSNEAVNAAAEIRRLEKAVHDDDAKNKHKRDPIAFLRSTS